MQLESSGLILKILLKIIRNQVIHLRLFKTLANNLKRKKIRTTRLWLNSRAGFKLDVMLMARISMISIARATLLFLVQVRLLFNSRQTKSRLGSFQSSLNSLMRFFQLKQ